MHKSVLKCGNCHVYFSKKPDTFCNPISLGLIATSGEINNLDNLQEGVWPSLKCRKYNSDEVYKKTQLKFCHHVGCKKWLETESIVSIE